MSGLDHPRNVLIVEMNSHLQTSSPTVTSAWDWKFEPDSVEASKTYREKLLQKNEMSPVLHFQMDMRDSPEDKERAILTFHKKANVEWACPFKCTLHGDPAIGDGVTRHVFATVMSKLQHGFELQLVPGGTLLFEGEKDHMIPSTSQCFLDSDLFVVAGRMIGHSFLHGGPCLTGLSPAIVHVLFGGSPETATIDILDCADVDIRQIIKKLEGTGDLSTEEKSAITDLALSWDLPAVTSENRRWLHDKLLMQAVLERTSKQLKQLRHGMKEMLIWPLLTERKDTIPLLFPRTSDALYTPKMLLERICWPDEDEDSDVSLEDTCRLTGLLRTFIENSSSNILRSLTEFWTGWDVQPRSLVVEVVDGNLPKSSTCYQTLKLPSHYRDYAAFERDFLAAICSRDYGFGLV
ncbi:uncharacterized protein LOC130552377 isoform X1 [Triplophysa rosa]|nr:uncharacterized protein LOC130552377 isoform X1 [Triplophysa rosa]